jgi:hypothetical protein
MGTIKEFKYKLIKNFLTKEEVNLLGNYCCLIHKLNDKNFDFGQNNNGDTYFYGDPIMESLMISKKIKIEEATKLKLLSTYTYWRMYTRFASLEPHTDRDACEISVSVMIAATGNPWPLKINNEEIVMGFGDAVIYLGRELEHSREEFDGDWQAQVFMHYVDKNGNFTDWEKDKRISYGIPRSK